MDPSIIPVGSKVVIDGVLYIAEDTGSAVKGRTIDIYVNEPKEETTYKDVYVELKK